MDVAIVDTKNYDYETIVASLREVFRLLDMDEQNPFGELVKPGDKVFIKPNWVSHCYRKSCSEQHNVYTTITHPSLIRALAFFADKALQGKGLITIGDNPSIDANFPELMKIQRLEDLHTKLNTKVRILDLRPLVCNDLSYYGQKDKMEVQRGDPDGETLINLGKASMFYGLKPKHFRGVFKDRSECIDSHTGENHLYSFSNSVYNSDLFISVPKLKTHHKTGVTLNLKGLVGTIGVKNQLVHWREGFPLIGGDAYPNFWSWFKDKFSKIKKRGAWSGNDTIWRMVVDLYIGIKQKQRRYFSVIDGVIGGEGDGPFCPKPRQSQVLIAGNNLLTTDIVATRLMGFWPEKIPYLNYFIKNGFVSQENITVISDFIGSSVTEEFFYVCDDRYLRYNPPSGWSNIVVGDILW